MLSIVTHSVRNDFIGLAIAAFIAWKLTVNKVINNAPPIAMANTYHVISVRYL